MQRWICYVHDRTLITAVLLDVHRSLHCYSEKEWKLKNEAVQRAPPEAMFPIHVDLFWGVSKRNTHFDVCMFLDLDLEGKALTSGKTARTVAARRHECHPVRSEAYFSG